MAFKGLDFSQIGNTIEEGVIRELRAKRNTDEANKLGGNNIPQPSIGRFPTHPVSPPPPAKSNGPNKARKFGTKHEEFFSGIGKTFEEDVIRELITKRNTDEAAKLVGTDVPEPAIGDIASLPYRPPTPPRTHSPVDTRKIGKNKKGKKK